MIATLFRIPQNRKQSACPLIGKEIKCVHTYQYHECYSAIKRKANDTNNWINFKGMLLGEKPVYKGYRLYDFIYITILK